MTQLGEAQVDLWEWLESTMKPHTEAPVFLVRCLPLVMMRLVIVQGTD